MLFTADASHANAIIFATLQWQLIYQSNTSNDFVAYSKIEKLIDVDAYAACRSVILYVTERRTRWYHKEKIALRAGFSREPGLSLVSNTIRYFALRTDQLLEFPLSEVGHTLIP